MSFFFFFFFLFVFFFFLLKGWLDYERLVRKHGENPKSNNLHGLGNFISFGLWRDSQEGSDLWILNYFDLGNCEQVRGNPVDKYSGRKADGDRDHGGSEELKVLGKEEG